jgi:hypothetical protein
LLIAVHSIGAVLLTVRTTMIVAFTGKRPSVFIAPGIVFFGSQDTRTRESVNGCTISRTQRRTFRRQFIIRDAEKICLMH